MENKNPIMLFILGFVTLIIGLALTPVIANQSAAASILNTNLNQTITFANNTIINLKFPDIVPNSEIVYGGQGVGARVLSSSNYTIDNTNGRITFINATPSDWYNNSLVNVTNQFYPSGYVKSSQSVTFVNLLPLFWALAVTIAGVYFTLEGFRNIGIIQ